MLLLTFTLSGACEIKRGEDRIDGPEQAAEVSRLLPGNRHVEVAEIMQPAVPVMSERSIIVLLKLCFLFSIDSFASGLVPQ